MFKNIKDGWYKAKVQANLLEQFKAFEHNFPTVQMKGQEFVNFVASLYSDQSVRLDRESDTDQFLAATSLLRAIAEIAIRENVRYTREQEMFITLFLIDRLEKIPQSYTNNESTRNYIQLLTLTIERYQDHVQV